jgi:hypothetical protein
MAGAGERAGDERWRPLRNPLMSFSVARCLVRGRRKNEWAGPRCERGLGQDRVRSSGAFGFGNRASIIVGPPMRGKIRDPFAGSDFAA